MPRAVKLHSVSAEAGSMQAARDRYVLITGGAGFIGTNLAHRLLSLGRRVLLYDNLSRPGVEQNLCWLCGVHGDRVQVRIADIRNRMVLREVLRQADQVFHLAAQVAVTTSLAEPVHDFSVNLQGTLNLLEEIRALEMPPPLVFTSTNKVYGDLEKMPLRAGKNRYLPTRAAVLKKGIDESCRLAFHSPYGCSKGAADQYVLDYARTFGLPAVVFRMSCIYGPHQFGTEDQGWVAHFLIRALEGREIMLYGDGRQVRDILFIEDLVEAFLLAQERMKDISGQAFNIGGGPYNTVSLLELLGLIQEMNGRKVQLRFGDWRQGDQKYYVSDYGKFQAATGWSPGVRVRQGLETLQGWLLESRNVPSAADAPALKRV